MTGATSDASVRLIMLLAGVGAAVTALELLSRRALFAAGGFFSWDILRTSRAWTIDGLPARVLAVVLRFPNVLALFALQLLSAVALVSGVLPALTGFWVSALFVSYLVFHLRGQYGLDGADQMQLIVFAALSIYFMVPTKVAQEAALWFICLQSLLSYLTAGVAKVVSPTWRSGDAIMGILATSSYGQPWLARLMARHSVLRRAACWSTIAFECAMPFLFILGAEGALIFITMGVIFHAAIAAVMGLNAFLWSFLATYPAILYCSNRLG